MFECGMPPVRLMEDEAEKLQLFLDRVEATGRRALFLGDGVDACREAICARLGEKACFAPAQHLGLRAASACARGGNPPAAAAAASASAAKSAIGFPSARPLIVYSRSTARGQAGWAARPYTVSVGMTATPPPRSVSAAARSPAASHDTSFTRPSPAREAAPRV
jgi:hypothetical protein